MQFWGLRLTWFDRKLLYRCNVSVIARHVGFCNVALGKKCWDNEMVKTKFFKNCYLVGFFEFGVTILVSKKDLDIAWRQNTRTFLSRNVHDTEERVLGRSEMAVSPLVVPLLFSLRSLQIEIIFQFWEPGIRQKSFICEKKCVCNELHNIVDGKSSNCDLSTVEAGGDCPGFNFTPVCEGIWKDFYFLF